MQHTCVGSKPVHFHVILSNSSSLSKSSNLKTDSETSIKCPHSQGDWQHEHTLTHNSTLTQFHTMQSLSNTALL